MLEAILQASFSEFLNEIEPGTWIPLGVFVLRDISVTIENDSWSDLRLLKTAWKAFYYTKSKGRKEESIGRVFKKLILVKWKDMK